MNKFTTILRYIIPYKFYAIANVVLNLLSVIFSLFSFTMAIPFLGILFDNQKLINNPVEFNFSVESIQHNFNYFISQIIVEEGKSQALFYVSILMMIMVFFKTIFWYLANFSMATLRSRMIRDIRNSIYLKVLKLPLGFFSNERKGDVMSRMTTDVQEIEGSVVSSLNSLFKEPITVLVYIATLIFMSPSLTIFVFILLPFTGLIIGKVGRNLRKKSHMAQTQMGQLIATIEETLSGLRIIKAFNSEKRKEKQFLEENEVYTNIIVKMWRRRYMASPLSEFLGTAVIVLVMWYGASLVLDNQSELTSQAFIGYLIVFSQIISPAKKFADSYFNIQKGMASANRISQITEAEIVITEKENPVKIEGFNKTIEYKNVGFKYDTEYVLKDINLKIEKGKNIALVGQSGSGKSTLVDLLPRFYDITEGKLEIDGIEIQDLKIVDLRHLMGNVNQEPILFNDTIFNNIAFGVENATQEEVEQAAKVANAHEFIMETEGGYQTNIGDRGSKLSGGQRQRLSIARAVLKNPPIMILDEATSALDTESERLVQDALNNLMKNRTSVVIAHRLSTVIHADEICVMHEGKIVERGRHEELLKQNGYYKRLHDVQMFG